jgi:hypothetical protein
MAYRGMLNANERGKPCGVAVFDDGLLVVRPNITKKRKLLFLTGGAAGGVAGAAAAHKAIEKQIAAAEHHATVADAGADMEVGTVMPADTITKVELAKGRLTLVQDSDSLSLKFGGSRNKLERIEPLLRGVLGDRVQVS